MTRFGWLAIAVVGGSATLIGLLFAAASVGAPRAAFVGVNVATLLEYGYDKHVAQTGGRRVPDAVLHILAAAGGTPGALAGQVMFRHKTRDRWFCLVFWAIAIIQLVLLLATACWRSW